MTGFDDARRRMVESQLQTEDVTDRAVIAAMGAVPRERFVPGHLRELAYIDRDLAIRDADGDIPARYLMEAAPLARLLQLADLTGGEFVLDVGTGTGYSAAVLARLAGSVVALEPDQDLADQAAETLSELEADNTLVEVSALEDGYAEEAPYDVIFVGGSVDFVPQILLDQLRDGGRLVAVVGRGRAGRATLFVRSGDVVGSRVVFDADVPPLPGFRKAPAFTF